MQSQKRDHFHAFILIELRRNYHKKTAALQKCRPHRQLGSESFNTGLVADPPVWLARVAAVDGAGRGSSFAGCHLLCWAATHGLLFSIPHTYDGAVCHGCIAETLCVNLFWG